MKYSPILYQTDMIRAYQNDLKTMTRRVMRRQPDNRYHSPLILHDDVWAFQKPNQGVEPFIIRCPYGQVGDKLWVREAWQRRADGIIEYRARSKGFVALSGWRPSIHMFRKDSRFTQTLTGVRAERLQDISLEDCLAEGISRYWYGSAIVASDEDLIRRYMLLWDSINAKRGYSWESNPYVWCLSFLKYSEELKLSK